MVNNSQDNDLAFLNKKDANSLSGKDIFFTILRNLHWLVLCALVCGGIAYFRSDRTDLKAALRRWTILPIGALQLR